MHGPSGASSPINARSALQGAEKFVCSADITAYKPGGISRTKPIVSAPVVGAAGPACRIDQNTGKTQ